MYAGIPTQEIILYHSPTIIASVMSFILKHLRAPIFLILFYSQLIAYKTCGAKDLGAAAVHPVWCAKMADIKTPPSREA